MNISPFFKTKLKPTLKAHQGLLISILIHCLLFGLLLYFRPDYRSAIKEYIDVSVFDLKQEIKEEVEEHLLSAPKPVQELAQKIPSVAKMVAPQAKFNPSQNVDEGPVKEYIDHDDIGVGGIGKLPDEGSDEGSASGAVNGGGTLSDIARQKFDRELWEAYGSEISRRCLKHLHYPQQAQRNAWQGDVDVWIKVSSAGEFSFEVKKGSQYLVLDKQALEMVKKAAAEVALPEKYRGKQIQIIIPVEFRLR